MSAVAVQSAPVGLHSPFRQKRHPAPPPASLTARTPGIITLSKPITPQRQSPRRKATPPRDAPPRDAVPTPKEKRKPRSRPTSDEDEHQPRGRNDKAPVTPKPRRQSRTRQTPSPDSDSPPQLQKPSGRLAKSRKGFTKSTPALCAAVAGSAPVPVPQVTSSSHPSGLSRSAPMSTPAMSGSIPARMRRTLTGGPSRDEPKDVPPSPSPRRVREPLTAPLNGGAGFPRPSHNRSPSEVFNLSLDETDDEPHDMPILFARRSGDKVYAGGRFQNGPDPTMLPAPSFLSGF